VTSRSWGVDPDRPLPSHSPWWPALAAARRFAATYAAYETGQHSRGVRRALEQTSTASFAHQLLAHLPVIPGGLGPANLAEIVRAADPLERLPNAALVLVAVVRRLDGAQTTGTIALRLIDYQQRWLVDGLSVLS
jgi:hypothetical protein